MGVIRFRLASLLVVASAALGVVVPVATVADPEESDTVIWYEDDRRPIPMPEPEFPNETITTYDENLARPTARFFHPSRFIRRFGGDVALPAANINAYDEVPNSTWFTNRIGLFPMTPESAARGPQVDPPCPDGPLCVTGAKTDGVTAGCKIKDEEGEVFLLKMDPAGYPGTTVRASIISGRILHAAGYNVPDEYVITFGPEDLAFAAEAKFRSQDGEEVPLSADSLRDILGPPHTDDGRWIALASHFIKGTALGPFDYQGRRGDDPNDRIDHEDRRELRGLRVISAWLNHIDSKRDNTLDFYIGPTDQGYVKHYLIDFASTLGSGGTGPHRKWGWEYGMDVPASTGRLLTIGFHESHWKSIERPWGLDEIGYMDNRGFDPAQWKPIRPNSAFANLTDRDGYWAAKIITAFTDRHLAAIVAEAKYRDPAATEFMTRALAERRDMIGRYYFDRVPPLDFFSTREQALHFVDLGVERGLYDAERTRYRTRWKPDSGGNWSEWTETGTTTHAWDEGTRARFQWQVSRGDGWSATTEVVVAASGQIVSLKR